MGYYATCDVKGCDEICQIDAFGAQPKGWFCVHFDVDDEEQARAIAEAKERGMIPGGVTPEGEIPPDGPMLSAFPPGGAVKISRTVLMCPNHDMPDFDPEPVGARLFPRIGHP